LLVADSADCHDLQLSVHSLSIALTPRHWHHDLVSGVVDLMLLHLLHDLPASKHVTVSMLPRYI
jgi:hypothetical protein